MYLGMVQVLFQQDTSHMVSTSPKEQELLQLKAFDAINLMTPTP